MYLYMHCKCINVWKFFILCINDTLYKAILDLLVMWSLKVWHGSNITTRDFMFLLLMMSESSTLRDDIVYLSKLFLVPITRNIVFESFIPNWFSIIHFLTLITLHSRFSLTMVSPGLKDSVREWSSAYPHRYTPLYYWVCSIFFSEHAPLLWTSNCLFWRCDIFQSDALSHMPK